MTCEEHAASDRRAIANNTEAAYGWLLTRAIPLVVPTRVCHGIEMIMSDADATMGAVITDCCRSSSVFPNAIYCFCVYHFERNCFQEFGVGARRFGLKKSTCTRKKGGVYEWGHDSRRDLGRFRTFSRALDRPAPLPPLAVAIA
jgi:hypothetical protein